MTTVAAILAAGALGILITAAAINHRVNEDQRAMVEDRAWDSFRRRYDNARDHGARRYGQLIRQRETAVR